MRIMRSLAMAGTAMLAGYVMKKLMGQLEAQMEQARVRAEASRQPKDLKRLRQDPVTGVYYAED